MGTFRQQARREQARHVGRRDRPVGDTATRRGNFDQWLQPEHAARAVAHQAQGNAALRRLLRDRGGHGISAEGQRRGIARDEDRHPHGTASSAASSASNLSGVTCACSVVSST